MNITRFVKSTSGGLHSWYETDMGFLVRKPNQGGKEFEYGSKKSWWLRFKEWLIRLLDKIFGK